MIFYPLQNIPHQKPKSRLATILRNTIVYKNENGFTNVGRKGPYFVKVHSDSKRKYTEEDVIKMLEFLVDNIFVDFAVKDVQQIIDIPIDTNCDLPSPQISEAIRSVIHTVFTNPNFPLPATAV